jgi:prepilin-type N-terminal cleavage/methylation domain-containing protein
MKLALRRQSAFTLIEVLVSLAVFSILASIHACSIKHCQCRSPE